MGIVVNQSIKNVVITCLGFGIGAVNTLFLFTHFLEKEYYGLVSYLISASNLIWPLLAFGVQNTLVKFFSSYTNQEQQNKFLSLMLVLPLGIALVLGSIAIVFYSSLLDFFNEGNTIVKPYVWTIFVLAFAGAYFELFFSWSKVKLKSVFGNLMKELFLRVTISALLFMVYLKILSVDQFIYALVIAYVLRMLIMLLYAFSLHQFKFSFSVPDNVVSVLKYSSLILIAGSVATLLIDLDKAMIERYMPIENLADYQLSAFIAIVIIIPSRAMHQITYPLTAKLMNEKAYSGLKELYTKSSITLLTISGLLFVLIICNVHELFAMLPEKYELYIWVVILIGGVKLFDNFLGNNNSILYNSDYYRIILYIGVGMAVLMVVLNLICIPVFGITGAAMATFTSVVCYNLAKLWIVNTKFKMHPFSRNTFVAVLLIVLFVLGFYFWEFPFHPVINITLKSFLITISYIVIVYALRVSADINSLLKKYISR
ncbi:oligosaccharide flippase family protein [Aquimarina mytili]|uniref:Polysaccharide biosynthesis C-terminal domain-containing protein n=1 Tax=Aquimarina mytili TaxID=874423 RepID=A0A937A7T6_9FLAO|nr:polysaccharide biosynthesis C-terminal domain-containing protein [Aquimarina mytili]MBL0685819.1 polysaccharide biosynthesis C-terminal domain-containing protein [Aquimarina mytili]